MVTASEACTARLRNIARSYARSAAAARRAVASDDTHRREALDRIVRLASNGGSVPIARWGRSPLAEPSFRLGLVFDQPVAFFLAR